MGVSATMSSDTEEPAKFDKVRRFFLASEWATMTFYEKMSFVKIRKDLKRMKREGKDCSITMYMQYCAIRTREKGEGRRVTPSSSDSLLYFIMEAIEPP